MVSNTSDLSMDQELEKARARLLENERKAEDKAKERENSRLDDSRRISAAKAIVSSYLNDLSKANIPSQQFEIMAGKGVDPNEINRLILAALKPYVDSENKKSTDEEKTRRAILYIESQRKKIAGLKISPLYLEMLARDGASENELEKVLSEQGEIEIEKGNELRLEEKRLADCRVVITAHADELKLKKENLMQLEWLVSVQKYSPVQIREEINRKLVQN